MLRYISHYFLLMIILSGCSSVTSVDETAELIVRMLGVYEAPADATGNQDPKWQIYTLEGVVITLKDTGESFNLLTENLGDLKIVENPQIVFRADLTGYIDKTLSGVTLTYNSAVTGGTSLKKDHALSLETTEYTLAEELPVSDSKDINVTAKVKWRNTVTRSDDETTETMSLPEISMSSVAPE